MASELTVGSLSNVKTAGNIHMESTLPVIHLDGAGGAAKSSAIYFTEAGHDAPHESVSGYAGSIEYDGVVNQLVIGGYSGGTAKPGIKIARDTGLCSFSNGIAFSSQTDTSATGAAATSTTLDHYEEGTWTPVVAGGTTAGTYNSTYSVAAYTRIGRVVTVNFTIDWNSHTGTGTLLITGLPFTVSSSTTGTFQCNSGLSWTAGSVPALYATGTQCHYRCTDEGGGAYNAIQIAATGSYLRGTLTYVV